jgi:hypothetical protein
MTAALIVGGVLLAVAAITALIWWFSNPDNYR